MDDRIQARIEAEKRKQHRGRILRSTLRWGTLGCGLLAFALIWMAFEFNIPWMAYVGAFLMIITLPLALAAFLVGALAPASVRGALSKRERNLLDN